MGRIPCFAYLSAAKMEDLIAFILIHFEKRY